MLKVFLQGSPGRPDGPLRAPALQELYSEYEEVTRSAYTPRAVCCLLSMHKKWKSTSAPGQRIRRQPIEKFLAHIRKDKCWNASNFSKGRYAIQSWIDSCIEGISRRSRSYPSQAHS